MSLWTNQAESAHRNMVAGCGCGPVKADGRLKNLRSCSTPAPVSTRRRLPSLQIDLSRDNRFAVAEFGTGSLLVYAFDRQSTLVPNNPPFIN
jgi:hypothetical protein